MKSLPGMSSTPTAGMKPRSSPVYWPGDLRSFFPGSPCAAAAGTGFNSWKCRCFPGYLFVHSDLSSWAYNDIIRHQGVVSILGSKGRCTPVTADTVASIQVDPGEWPRAYTPGPVWYRADRVRVIAGPLCGAIGTIWRCKPGKRRLVVGVELLGRSIAVDLEEECVELFS